MTAKRRHGRKPPQYGRFQESPWVDVLSHIGGFLKRKRGRGYVVGGFLRDVILGQPSKDLDLVVTGVAPSALAFNIHKTLGFSRPVVFPRFKTALTVGRGIEIEICVLRGDLKEDALQRDFTMNCLYKEIGLPPLSADSVSMLDPTGRGFKDLGKGVLRTPADPCLTLWLDPLRILRAFRLNAVKGFKMAEDLHSCIPRLVYLIDKVARERVRTELEKILLSTRVRSSFRKMQTLGVCGMVLPELSGTHGFDQSTPYHDYDLFNHSLKATANTPADLAVRLAALLHDLGKPATRIQRAGRAVYYGHEEVSASLAEDVLRRLGFSRRIRKKVVFLVRNHMIHYSPEWSDKAVRRFVRKMGPYLEDMLLLAEADQKAQSAEARPDIPVRHLRKRIRDLRESAAIHLEAPMDGREIMSVLGIGEGPLVGEAKNRLIEEASARDRPMTRREAAEVLRKWAKRQKP